jgi:hypothetical protein
VFPLPKGLSAPGASPPPEAGAAVD